MATNKAVTFAVEGATVIINGEERDTYCAPYGTEITWSVSKDGYRPQSGSFTLTEDKTIDVVLALLGNPFTFVYDNNSMFIYRGSVYTSNGTSCLFAIDGDYDIEINGVFVGDVSESTTFGSDYLNDTGNIVKIYTHEGTTINHRYANYTNGANTNQTRFISEIQTWGDATFGDCTYMFAMSATGASTLKKVPQFGKGFADVTSVRYMFHQCDSITEVEDDLFANCPNMGNIEYLFDDCEGLKSIPDNLLASCSQITSVAYVFSGSGLVEVPSTLFAKMPNITAFQGTFSACPNLTTVPGDLFAACVDATNFGYCFNDCPSFTTIPEGLFAACTKVTNFQYTFNVSSSGTPALTGESAYDLVEIDGIETKVHLYERTNYPDIYATISSSGSLSCYHNQTGLDDYTSMPSAWR